MISILLPTLTAAVGRIGQVRLHMTPTTTDVDGGTYETHLLHLEFTALTVAGIMARQQLLQKQTSLIKMVTGEEPEIQVWTASVCL